MQQERDIGLLTTQTPSLPRMRVDGESTTTRLVCYKCLFTMQGKGSKMMKNVKSRVLLGEEGQEVCDSASKASYGCMQNPILLNPLHLRTCTTTKA